MRNYFGTDGIRGVANRELTADLALRIGAAAAKVLLNRPHGVSVLIGRDPRISGDMLESALAAGFASRGADVILVGVIPTPGVAVLVREADVDVGCVISASHNPVEYNGIKFFGQDGEKLADETESEIESHLNDPVNQALPVGENIGRFLRQPQRVERYVYAVKQTARRRLNGLKLVMDGANGAAFDLAPRIFRELGAEVVTIGCDPDGANINAGLGSTHPERMLEMVQREGADAGLAFDGDADRVLMASEDGKLVDGDKIMAICGIDMDRRGVLPGRRVIATVMSNVGLEVALQRHGILLDRVEEVGDRYVAERMRATGARIGGEKSGHIILSEYTTTGDGMVTALQVLGAMQDADRRLSELANEVEEYPQVLDGVRVRDKSRWKENPAISSAIDEASNALRGRGRLHVRASGTEPLIRVMAEGPVEAELKELVGGVCSAIRETIGAEN
ncbi:MAG: phosphoglucosamine mutase [Armatimonadetes bacterium]|nr:phosphoglucosamine mutase [Armatimonadota bacterium]